MTQSSGPISQGTTAERQFTDVLWRNRFGDEPGVLADLDGTSYSLTLPTTGDVVSVGSSTQDSTATVAGFVHTIPQSAPEPITIPTASGSTRTDIIALRYDPAYTGLPGPVRLVRIAGSSSAVPAYDSSPPGVEELPLWSITRAVGQALNLATVVRMFPRITPMLEIAVGAPLPSSSPLGTSLRQGTSTYRRLLNPTTPAWVKDPGSRPRIFKRSGTPGTTIPAGGANETGIGGITALASFTLVDPGVFSISAMLRAGATTAGTAVTASVKIDGTAVGYPAVQRADGTVPIVDAVTLAAGTHTIAARVDNSGSTSIGWTNFLIVLTEGIAE